MTSKHWFQRRRVGFGWRPADWHGWVITLLAVAATIAVLVLLRGSSARIPVMILIVAAYVVVALATGGTRPAEEAPAADEPTDSEANSSGRRRAAAGAPRAHLREGVDEFTGRAGAGRRALDEAVR